MLNVYRVRYENNGEVESVNVIAETVREAMEIAIDRVIDCTEQNIITVLQRNPEACKGVF